MKKIFKILLCVLVIIIIGIILKLVYPTFNKTYKYEELNVSFSCPIHYEKLETKDGEITYQSNQNGIKISVYKFSKNFLSQEGITQKMKDYKSVVEAKNYDCVLERSNLETMLVSNIESGKVTLEIKSLKQLNKEVTLIIPTEKHDLIFTVYGVNEQMVKNEKQIEKILNSIKIK